MATITCKNAELVFPFRIAGDVSSESEVIVDFQIYQKELSIRLEVTNWDGEVAESYLSAEQARLLADKLREFAALEQLTKEGNPFHVN